MHIYINILNGSELSQFSMSLKYFEEFHVISTPFNFVDRYA
jgi:hypothetical protein